MSKFYLPPPREIEEKVDSVKNIPSIKPGKLLAFVVYLLSLAYLITGLVSAVFVIITDRHFSGETDMRINYYPQAETLIWIYGIIALVNAALFAYLGGKINSSKKSLFWFLIVLIPISAYISANLYWYAFLNDVLELPSNLIISYTKLTLSPITLGILISLSVLALILTLSKAKYFGNNSAPLGDGAKRYFYFILIITTVLGLNIYLSLNNGFSTDFNYGSINSYGRYHLYKTSGEVEGLRPITKLTEMSRPVAQRENAVFIEYGTPFEEMLEGKETFTVKATLTMVGLPDNIDLLSFVHSLPKTTLTAKPYKPVLGSRRTHFGYMVENKGTLTLIFITEDNVLILLSSAYLSDSQLLNFANSLH